MGRDLEISIEALKNVVRLGVMTCACDGEVHPDEDAVLKDWIYSRFSRKASMLERVYKDAMKQLNGEGIELKKVCKKLADADRVALKYDAMDLCLRIAQIDGVGSEDEMRYLMSVGKWLELDYDKFREMRDKILPANIHETIDVDSLLGLHNTMSKREKLKHLTQEYSKWNHLRGHSNPEKRQQAEDMVEIISQKRKEVQGE